MPNPTEPAYPAYSPYGQPPGGQHYGSMPPQPPGGYGVPPAPPTQKKAPVGLIIGGAVAALVVIGGAVGAVVLLKGHGKGGLPVDAKLLPGQTKEVGTRLIEATREPNEQVKRIYLASELGSEMCAPGISDPARKLEGIGAMGSRTAKDFFFNKSKIDDVQQLLDCGSLLSAELSSPYQGVVEFDDDNMKTRQIATTQSKVTEIPTKFGFTPYRFGQIPGFCQTRDKNTLTNAVTNVDCTENRHAAFPKDGTWYIGDRATLETMAKSVQNPHTELSSSVAALKDAAEQTDGLPIVRLAGNPKTSKDFFMAPCFWGGIQTGGSMTEFMDGCFPAKQEDRAITEIDAKIKGAAYELDSDYTKAGAVLGNIVFVARDNDGAKTLEKDVQDVVTDWKAHLENNDAKLIKSAKDNAHTHSTKKFVAVVDTFFAALKKMKVVRSGRTVRISYNEKLSPDDIQELIDADKSTVDKRVATANVLEAIQNKRAIPVAQLAVLVGQKWATYLTGPPPPDPAANPKVAMSASECQAAQRQLGAVKYTELSLPSAKELYFQIKFATCSSSPPVIYPTQRLCLASFKTATDLTRCSLATPAATPTNEPPESEYGDNAKK